jgi:secondary thiamine-phosphate synthase enzyme
MITPVLARRRATAHTALAHRSAKARRRPCRHVTIRLTTRHPTEFIDLTERLEELVADADVRFGILNVQTRHTTTAVVVNEHEPLLLADLQGLLERAAPADARYRHDDATARTVNVTAGERANGHAHCRALLLPSSVALNVVSGRLLLGQWQRVFLVELDGPREREISALLLGEAGQ